MTAFIVVEGIDGCGKSTAAKSLTHALGEDSVLTREPTDSWIGSAVRSGGKDEVSPYLDALLFMADRAQHTLQIKKWLDEGRSVVCDRYYHSTVAYQTAYLRRRSLGDNFDWLLKANNRISIHPDVTFLLVLDPEKAIERVEGRGSSSRFEKTDFLREVQANYERLARADDTIVLIDGGDSPERIVDCLLRDIKERKL
ncbi:MAG: dTMP kinase [Methanobacteriota archaeon]|nr:MAG: dTMP kinase [Euryarchaeota archaeon]